MPKIPWIVISNKVQLINYLNTICYKIMIFFEKIYLTIEIGFVIIMSYGGGKKSGVR